MRRIVENISRSINLYERMLPPGSNPQPPDLQSDAHLTEMASLSKLHEFHDLWLPCCGWSLPMNGDAWYILLSMRFNILEHVITELVLWQQIFDLVNVGLFKYLDNYNKELRCPNI